MSVHTIYLTLRKGISAARDVQHQAKLISSDPETYQQEMTNIRKT